MKEIPDQGVFFWSTSTSRKGTALINQVDVGCVNHSKNQEGDSSSWIVAHRRTHFGLIEADMARVAPVS